MNVQADLLDHPKFLLLKRELGELGPLAAELLLRLWGHCQENKRGGDWGKVSADYVEMVCKWSGPAGTLFRALLKPMMPGRAGFAEMRGQRFIVHDWDAHNSGLISRWDNGKLGGRPRKPEDNREETGRISDASRNGTSRETNKRGVDGSGGEVSGGGLVTPPDPAFGTSVQHPPALETVVAFGAQCRPVCPEENCRRFWHYYQGKKWRGVSDFRPALVNWWEEDLKKSSKLQAPSSKETAEEMDGIDAELGWQTDAVRIAALKKRRRELKAGA